MGHPGICCTFCRGQEMPRFIPCGSLNQRRTRIEAPPSPLSSRPKWRDLRFSQPASDSNRSSALPFVIPTEVEGSAVLSTSI
jgi:hypothetical protein